MFKSAFQVVELTLDANDNVIDRRNLLQSSARGVRSQHRRARAAIAKLTSSLTCRPGPQHRNYVLRAASNFGSINGQASASAKRNVATTIM
jgi:hypothetical protein